MFAGIPVAVAVNIMTGYIVSLGYVLICICVCGILKSKLSVFISRKILHILMANWWYIRLAFINCRLLWLGPLAFMIILNIYARKKEIKRGMEYFCLSLSIMTMITAINMKYIVPATSAILIMGYADAAAAIFGKAYQNYKKTDKTYSIVGSIAFFTISNVVLFICMGHTVNIIYLIFVSLLLTFIEAAIFPKYDNITVPMFAFLMMLLPSFEL